MVTSTKCKPKRKTSSANGKPKYQPLPDLPTTEFEILKADIAENGLQYPVIQDDKGNTLDGHQRERALKELGIKNYPVKVIAGLSEEEKWHYALSVNIKRRNLTTAQKRALIGQELKRTPHLANNWLAEILGVDVKTVQSTRKRLESTLEIPKLKKLKGKDGKRRTTKYAHIVANTPNELTLARKIAKKLPSSANGRTMDTVTAARYAKRSETEAAINGRVVKPSPTDAIRMYHCRFQNLEEKSGLTKNSVQLLLTDIPYDHTFVKQLPELAAFAERLLAPGGLLVSYSGQFYLPQVIEAFGEHLTYRWLAMSTWNGDSNMVFPLNINSMCKPILIFSKGKWKKRGQWIDVLKFDMTKEKRWHPHQQPLKEVERLVGYFSKPKDLVVDPCMVAATTALACRNLGRNFVGCDSDKKSVLMGQKRLREKGSIQDDGK